MPLCFSRGGALSFSFFFKGPLAGYERRGGVGVVLCICGGFMTTDNSLISPPSLSSLPPEQKQHLHLCSCHKRSENGGLGGGGVTADAAALGG